MDVENVLQVKTTHGYKIEGFRHQHDLAGAEPEPRSGIFNCQPNRKPTSRVQRHCLLEMENQLYNVLCILVRM